MAYIIDGHNLIPKIPHLTLRAIDDEIELIKILQRFCLEKRKKVEVFFDKAPAGQARTQTYGAVKAIFVREGITADQAILNHLKRLGGSARNYIVVSSDHEVRAGARAAHAKVLSSEEFSVLLSKGKSASPADADPGAIADISLDEREISQWLDVFNQSDSEE